MRISAVIGVIVMTVGCMVLLSWASVRIPKEVQVSIEITHRLKRAADANSIALATQELTAALKGIESRGLTAGYTSILWRTPDEDLGFWYENLRGALADLKSTPETVAALERSNVLMKLRETLLDGTMVTRPDGVSVYPHNIAYALWIIMGSVLVIFGLVVLAINLE